jgi:hypothetical protein
MALTGVQGTNSPHIIIEEGTSINGFATVNQIWAFGEVVEVYAGCNTYAVGDNVFYDKSQGRRFKLSTINYFAIDEQYIFFTETPPLS